MRNICVIVYDYNKQVYKMGGSHHLKSYVTVCYCILLLYISCYILGHTMETTRFYTIKSIGSTPHQIIISYNFLKHLKTIINHLKARHIFVQHHGDNVQAETLHVSDCHRGHTQRSNGNSAVSLQL